MVTNAIQYSTSEQIIKQGGIGGTGNANIVSDIDKVRVNAYDLYDGFYHNRQESLKVYVRGDDQNPIYIPSAKKIIEATSRYLMVNFDYFTKAPDAEPLPGEEESDAPVTGDTAEDTRTVDGYFAKMFKREKVKAKFIRQKRYSLIRGDAFWYITADPNKEQGARLSLHELDPRHYFPIEDPNDTDRVIGCHIVDLVPDPRKPDDLTAQVARRQTYRKDTGPDGKLRAVTSERLCFEIGKWDDRVKANEIVPVPNPDQDMPLADLPPQITQLPVYHLKNSSLPNATFGMSEISGLETAILSINQTITDEDLTMIMQGLGMYVTNAGPPEDGAWNVGPGQVIETGQDQRFERVTGVSSVSPYTEHMKTMDDAIVQGSGTPEIAIGIADVAVAESGIALMLQMGPILAKNAEKELEFLLTHDQMFYDIVNMWLPAYEEIDPGGNEVLTIVDNPMPVNRDAKVQELMLLYTSGVITLSMVVSALMELGYQFPSSDPQMAAEMIREEQKQKSQDMMGDPYAYGDAGVGEGEDQGGFGGDDTNGQLSLGTT